MPQPDVIADLSRWGPNQKSPLLSLRQSEQYCQALARSHYENFPVVSWLLPRHLHQHFYNVYAFCRWADDLGDESGDPKLALQRLAWWREQLDECYAGKTTHPVFIALTPTIRQFDIPRGPFADLISAFEQDQSVRQYETFAELHDYCRRSANPVGRLVLSLCQRLDDQNVIWSDAICTGLQLANFWQDVARDYAIGRVYLPREDRLRFQYTDEMLNERRSTPQFQNLLEFEVERAREFLNAGSPLAARMPGRLQIEIDLFRRGGLLILDAIQQRQYHVWEHRPVVRKSQLAKAAFASMAQMLFKNRLTTQPSSAIQLTAERDSTASPKSYVSE